MSANQARTSATSTSHTDSDSDSPPALIDHSNASAETEWHETEDDEMDFEPSSTAESGSDMQDFLQQLLEDDEDEEDDDEEYHGRTVTFG
jgi:hypothetical protein